MALIKCPECGKEISDKSQVCIHCGYPLENLNTTQNENNPDLSKTVVVPIINEEKTIPDNSQPESQEKYSSVITNNEEKENNKDDKLAIIFIITGILAVLVIGIMLINKYRGNKQEDVNQSNTRNQYIEQIMITTDYINIRSERSTNSGKLGKVYKGEIYTVLSEETANNLDWYEIETETGIRGYIANDNGYTRKLNVYSNEETETTTVTTTTTTKATNKPQNNTTTQKTTQKTQPTQKPASTTTKPTTTTTTTTTTTQQGYTISSIEGIGSSYSRYGSVCRLDSFNASFDTSYSTLKLNFNYKLTMQSKTGTCDWCEFIVKVYDSSGVLLKTDNLYAIHLEAGEQTSKSDYLYLDTDDRTFRIKIIPYS